MAIGASEWGTSGLVCELSLNKCAVQSFSNTLPTAGDCARGDGPYSILALLNAKGRICVGRCPQGSSFLVFVNTTVCGHNKNHQKLKRWQIASQVWENI